MDRWTVHGGEGPVGEENGGYGKFLEVRLFRKRRKDVLHVLTVQSNANNCTFLGQLSRKARLDSPKLQTGRP